MLYGVRDALLQSGDITVVGLTHRGEEVVDLVGQHRPDLVLLDHHMPGVDGLTCLRAIKQRWPEINVVMLSASEEPDQIAEALAAGASAYIGKRVDPEDLGSLLRQVAAGVVYRRSWSEPRAGTHAVNAGGLTPRERAILEEAALGHSTKVISANLWISEKTVKFHLTNIYRKLGVHNRAGATRYAFEHNIVTADVTDGSARAAGRG
jgi:DNA-binding NarL/FixJ family response regulator